MRFFRRRLPKQGSAKSQEKKHTGQVEHDGGSHADIDDTEETANSLISATSTSETKHFNKDEARGVVKDENEDKIPHDQLPSAEGLQKRRIIELQRKREEMASVNDTFVVNQQVSYFFKANETRYNATIVGVHYDDGPDRPYYTVRFWRNEVEDNDEGIESVVCQIVEKQTTPDRLERVDFDPEQTWRVLNN